MNKVLLSLCVVLATVVAKAETKIGFVDVPKAIQATSAGKKAKAELEGQFNKKKKELEKKEADLKKMNEDLEKKKTVLSEEALHAKQAEFQGEMMKFRDEVAKSQSEIQKRQQELTAPILEKMQKTIAKVSKDQGYSLVLQNTQGVLYATPDADLTDAVVKAFEKDK